MRISPRFRLSIFLSILLIHAAPPAPAEEAQELEVRVCVLGTFASQRSHLETRLGEAGFEAGTGADSDAWTSGSLTVRYFQSRMGLVNNALTTQHILDTFKPDVFISIGMAGSLADAGVGQLLIVTDAVQHDSGTWKPYGFIWSRMPDRDALSDARLISLVRDHLTAHPESAPLGVAEGRIVSGSQFIMSEEKRDWLVEKFDAVGVDMQAYAILQACARERVPCLALRTFSDSASATARTQFSRAADAAVNQETNAALGVILKLAQNPRAFVRAH